jgi:catechol 2,3-dioxygenase-like lactoylglutathione lyase family enzyme
MARHFLDHIDLRVSNLAEARKFYDGWLPALGLSEIVDEEDQRGYTMPGGRKDTPFVWLDLLPGHRGGANRIAFWADSEEEVNRLGKIVVGAWAGVLPRLYAGILRRVFRGCRREQVGDLLPVGAGEVRSGLWGQGPRLHVIV